MTFSAIIFPFASAITIFSVLENQTFRPFYGLLSYTTCKEQFLRPLRNQSSIKLLVFISCLIVRLSQINGLTLILKSSGFHPSSDTTLVSNCGYLKSSQVTLYCSQLVVNRQESLEA